LIVACLLLAAGNPVLSLGRIKPQSIVVILDNSASMQAVELSDEATKRRSDEGLKTRLSLARRAIEELTTRRPVNDEWMLVEAARRPRVLVSWTYDRKSLRDAADGLQPFFGSADLAAAKDLAGQLLAGKERPCIVIISDGAAGQVEKLAQSDSSVVFWPIG